MTIEEFCSIYPKLYHMADKDSYESVMRHGLLSTASLLELFEVDEQRRFELECKHRQESVTIAHPIHGTAVIRDQKPMSDSLLQRCLTDMTPEQWYKLLNSFVFFWVSKERLERLLGGRAYRNQIHCVFEVNTADVMADHAGNAFLAPINTGNCKPNPQPRGSSTFLPIEKYPFEDWQRKRRKKDVVVECAIKGGVPQIANYRPTIEYRKVSK